MVVTFYIAITPLSGHTSTGGLTPAPLGPTSKGHRSSISCTASPSRGPFLYDSSFYVRDAQSRQTPV